MGVLDRFLQDIDFTKKLKARLVRERKKWGGWTREEESRQKKKAFCSKYGISGKRFHRLLKIERRKVRIQKGIEFPQGVTHAIHLKTS